MAENQEDLNQLQNELINALFDYVNLLIDAETEQNDLKIFEKMLEKPLYYKLMINKVQQKNKQLKDFIEKKPKKSFVY